MEIENHDEITTLLHKSALGNPASESELIRLIYQDLKHIAINRLRGESENYTLTVTALVHEAFLRLSKLKNMTWQSRRHYFGAAAEAMRRILIDRARYHLCECREGDNKPIQLEEGLLLEDIRPKELLDLDDALFDLGRYDSELAEIVKLKYYAGLSINDIAELHKVSPRTIDRRWQAARAWLLSEIQSK
jgi:RNA polymerase sigma factor (TIGR02999 family)